MNQRKSIGDRAENAAAKYLQRKGVHIVERNVFSRGGEIDLIGRDNQTLVFFEVRFRGHGSSTTAAESVDYRKQQRLLRAVTHYLHSKGLWDTDTRIDVIALSPGRFSQYNIQWIKNAIQGTT